jgi:CubicO group peptidase (beta-lactamase class C family)
MKLKLIALLFLVAFSCQAQNNATADRIKRVENSLLPNVIYGDSASFKPYNLEERMKESGVKGLSIAVIKDYKIEWAKAYGWADEEEKRKATTETRFQAASISKSLNSLGVLKLVEQGKLDSGADINNYLKSWKFPYDKNSDNKTINTNNLLSHTAGLTIHGFPGYKTTAELPTIPQILDGEKPANTKAVRSQFAPAMRFQYSGGGTTISQLIVTDITGRKYDEYMETEVLKPMGMLNSSYTQPPKANNLATAYYRNGQAVTGKYHLYPEQAAAGLWTTPTDLAKYIIECQLAYEGKSKKVLSQAMMQKRLTPYIDRNAALGVFIEERGGVKYFNHNGGNEAFLCTSYGSLTGGNGVVIMINSDNFSIIGELLNSVATVYNWKEFFKPVYKTTVMLSKEQKQLFTGTFQLGNDTLTIKFCGEDLCITQSGQPEPGFKLMFTDTDTFTLAEVPNATMKAIRKDNKIEALELNQGGGKMRLNRTK